MKNWYDIYVDQINKNGGIKKYMGLKIKQKKVLLKVLRKHSNNGKIIEAGCGTGIISSQLANEGYDVEAIDINEEVLKLAKKMEKEYFNNNNVKFIKKSIFELDYNDKSFDLCYSVGVLEHFEDKLIIQSLSKQIKISHTTILVIPTKWFDEKETLHGDDRFLPLNYWRKLIDDSNGHILKEYSYRFKSKSFKNIKKIKRIFRPKAYRIFVIKEKLIKY